MLAGLTLALFVYSIGHISGCHINPAVTLGLLSVKKISLRDAAYYIGAQVVGAIFAMAVVHSLGVSTTTTPSNALTVGIAEALGAFFFTFGIASVVAGRVHSAMNGLVVGGSLLLGIAIAAGAGSAGVLNPAVALALYLYIPAYLVGPIVGSVLGFNAYKMLNQGK